MRYNLSAFLSKFFRAIPHLLTSYWTYRKDSDPSKNEKALSGSLILFPQDIHFVMGFFSWRASPHMPHCQSIYGWGILVCLLGMCWLWLQKKQYNLADSSTKKPYVPRQERRVMMGSICNGSIMNGSAQLLSSLYLGSVRVWSLTTAPGKWPIPQCNAFWLWINPRKLKGIYVPLACKVLSIWKANAVSISQKWAQDLFF